MNHSRYFSDSRRSPYPRRRRGPVPRSPSLGQSLPAITLLSPDGYQLSQNMAPRPLSPGAFRMLPPKSAKQKMSSFVILNEMIESPVVSRAPSPSGRVSPFRGHGFKSPTSSRPGSRAPSPKPPPTRRKTAVVPVEKIQPVHVDIGLPPKSPKRVIKSVKIQEFKPIIKPKPILKEKKITPKVKVVSNKKPVVMSTTSKNKDKKAPVAPVVVSSTTSVDSKTESEVTTTAQSVDPSQSESDDPIIVSEVKPAEVQQEEKKKEERLIPCYQPDKCCVVPPTMASPTQTATSTTVVPSSTTGPSTTTAAVSRLSAISSAVSVSESLSRKALRPKTGPEKTIQTAVATMITVDEVIKSRASSAASRQTILSPTLSDRTRSSMVTVRAASNGSLRNHPDETGEVISTTKLIRAEPDFEVLSANNLVRPARPPSGNMEEPLWVDNGTPNGVAPSPPKTRCRRFFAALWRILSSVFCCWKKLTFPRCNVKKLCSCKPSSCCKRDPSKRCCRPCWNPFSCCSSNCCKKPCCGKLKCCEGKACCGKIKCCEGKACCKKSKKKSDKKMCCAKPTCSCSCKACCARIKNCCTGCGERINSFCRSLFCLNLGCCQRCLRKCTCCHKLKCCKKGGCCSCCNPHVKREVKTKLDKKTSRASNQSKQERAKLDPALVDHTSMMKASIPVLPACLAWFCLLLNIFIPGSGTLLSGLLCLCFGKPRFSVNDSPQNRMSSFLICIVIAVSQLFTIIFCLVGWGWSIWWGVIMVKLSRKQKRLRLAEQNQEAAPSTAQNHVDPERR